MIYTYTNGKLTEDLQPWMIEPEQIGRSGMFLKAAPMVTKVKKPEEIPFNEGKVLTLTDSRVTVSYRGKNLDPVITLPKPQAKLSFTVLLTSLLLGKHEKVLFVKNQGGYVVEWKAYSIQSMCDFVFSFRENTKASITIYTFNGQTLNAYTFTHTENNEIKVKEEKDVKDSSIRTSSKPFNLPVYRPYVPTELVFVHKSSLAKAKQVLGDKRVYAVYQNITELRKLAEKYKQEDYVIATIYHDVAANTELTKDQSFFTHALSEYFKFIHISYNDNFTSRKVFFGKSTIPQRKKQTTNARKPHQKKFDNANQKSEEKTNGSRGPKKPFTKRPSQSKNEGTGSNGPRKSYNNNRK